MMRIEQYKGTGSAWDDYVQKSPKATIYHLSGWKSVIENTLGHKSYYLMAKENDQVKGILPLFLISSRLFGRFMVSLPFHCIGGVCADNAAAEQLLLSQAIEITKQNQAEYLELRQLEKAAFQGMHSQESKMTFVLPLEPDPEVVWKNRFTQNLRNKIRKAQKFNLTITSGCGEREINTFYSIFSRHMRDLGTPVLSKKLFESIVREFQGKTKIFIASRDTACRVPTPGKDVGAKFVMYFKDTVYFIWAAALREHMHMAPTSLLNWEVIRQSCGEGYKFCDFGRSTVNDGAYHYKKQYGVELRQLYWQYFLNTRTEIPNLNPRNDKYQLAIKVWQKLPVSLTRLIGPGIVKYIP